jgi:hypothetical protein
MTFPLREEIRIMNMSQKRSFVSPTKTQTSIVAFTSGNKRTNSNKTPTRSPIARAQEAILGPPSRKNKLLGNNPEEDDEMHEDDTCESYRCLQGMIQVLLHFQTKQDVLQKN